MIDQRLEGDLCDPACIACRIDAACTLLTEHPELASAITIVGATNCGETLAAVQRAQRAWPVEIMVRTQAGKPAIVNVEIRPWRLTDAAPARGAGPTAWLSSRVALPRLRQTVSATKTLAQAWRRGAATFTFSSEGRVTRWGVNRVRSLVAALTRSAHGLERSSR